MRVESRRNGRRRFVGNDDVPSEAKFAEEALPGDFLIWGLRRVELDNREEEFVNNNGGPGGKGPDEDGFDGEIALSADAKADHLLGLVAPPLVRDGEGSFPKLADGEEKKPGDGEGAPVHKMEGDVE